MTHIKTLRFSLFVLLALVSFVMVGCEDYDKPEFAEIDTSETGFMIPLEGDLKSQSAFVSEQYLSERKIAAKRVQITHRWVQDGRMWWSGHWMPTVRLIKVVRSPVTRQWEADNKAAPAHDQDADDEAQGDEDVEIPGFLRRLAGGEPAAAEPAEV